MSADCKEQITVTVNPGLVWTGKFSEFGIAAQIRDFGKFIPAEGCIPEQTICSFEMKASLLRAALCMRNIGRSECCFLFFESLEYKRVVM